MSESKEIIVKENGTVCTLILNRPEKRNLVTPTMLLELDAELKRLKNEDKVRCVILRGAGHRAFSSGYDITAIGKDDMIRNHEGNNPLPMAVQSIENFPYPVIAMINGHAFGAGLEIAAACDIRIAVDNCLFGMPPAKLGVVYSYSGVKRFLNLIGPGYTKELFLVGRSISSERAAAMGLVNFVVHPDKLEKFTRDMAEEITKNAPLSLKALKAMAGVWEKSLAVSKDDDELIKQLTLDVQNSEDYKEGQRAFAEKRKPVFKGK